MQPQATLPAANVAVGAVANTGAIPLPQSLDVSAAMNKPGFKRPKRRAAKPSATPPVVPDSVETYIQEETEQRKPIISDPSID